MKKLYEISWKVPESVYREDKALSYSTLARYNREGFNKLDHLFDKIETPSLLFGSAVDTLITGSEEEFNDNFIVAVFPDIPDSISKIVKILFNKYHITNRTLESISNDKIIEITNEQSYQTNWKPETRAKVIKEKGKEYYNILFVANNKHILSIEQKQQINNAVRALKESQNTKIYFADNNPFDETFYREYQLKFKATLNGIPYRCMADLLFVDHKNKIVVPIDLKTSSHTEWDFYKSFIDWNYQIQARLYWRIIRYNMDQDPFWKEYALCDYRFIVVNKNTLTPLVWEFKDTQKSGTLYYGKNKQIEFKDPENIGYELNTYLTLHPSVPINIDEVHTNDIIKWLNTL